MSPSLRLAPVVVFGLAACGSPVPSTSASPVDLARGAPPPPPKASKSSSKLRLPPLPKSKKKS